MPQPRRVTRRPRPINGESSPAALGREVTTVGIDASLTGYGMVAFYPGTGVAVTRLIKTKADGDFYAVRLAEIVDSVTQFLTDLRDNTDLRLIAMERAAYDASGAFTGGLVHAATALALLQVFGPTDNRCRMPLVAGNTLKKFVTGKGVGKKQLMVKFVYQKWGFDTNDDNLADAYGLARLASALLFGAEHKYERDCIATVKQGMSWDPQSGSAALVATPSRNSTPSRSTRQRPAPMRGAPAVVSAKRTIGEVGQPPEVKQGLARRTRSGPQRTPRRSRSTA